jgi:hypothetical protein
MTSNNFTLAGTPAWQEAQANNPAYRRLHFTERERAFINEALNSEGWKEGFTGTKVELIEPEGSDCHWSQISSDHEEDPEMTDAEDATGADGQPKMTRKGKFKNMAKKLYPRKMVGGAKVMGGAIRHPMVTGRKVNKFVRRKNNTSAQNAGVPRNLHRLSCTTDDLPPLTRSATTSEWDMRPTGQQNSTISVVQLMQR